LGNLTEKRKHRIESTANPVVIKKPPEPVRRFFHKGRPLEAALSDEGKHHASREDQHDDTEPVYPAEIAMQPGRVLKQELGILKKTGSHTHRASENTGHESAAPPAFNGEVDSFHDKAMEATPKKVVAALAGDGGGARRSNEVKTAISKR